MYLKTLLQIVKLIFIISFISADTKSLSQLCLDVIKQHDIFY